MAAATFPIERFIYHLDTEEIVRFDNEGLAMQYVQQLKSENHARYMMCGLSAFEKHAIEQIATSKRPGSTSCWECGRIYSGHTCPACGESEND